MKTEDRQKYLHKYVDAMNDEQIEFMYDLFSLRNNCSKMTVMKTFAKDIHTFDYAIPHGMVERIAQGFPDAKNGLYVFNYSDGKQELTNIKNKIADKILDFLVHINNF